MVKSSESCDWTKKNIFGLQKLEKNMMKLILNDEYIDKYYRILIPISLNILIVKLSLSPFFVTVSQILPHNTFSRICLLDLLIWLEKEEQLSKKKKEGEEKNKGTTKKLIKWAKHAHSHN